MPLEKWSDSVIVVHLGDDPQFEDDLSAIDAHLSKHKCDVVLDFSAVSLINSSNLAGLLRLRKRMGTDERKLVLCGMSSQSWGAFLITGLDKIFHFSDSVPTALATIQMR
jgi:anti-anti-sigma factor